MENLDNIFTSINSLLESVNLDEVSADSAGNRDELPDGYYNCEVEKAELTVSKSSNQPMVAFQFKVCDPGTNVIVNEDGSITKTEIKNTVNRKVFLYYVLKDEKSVKRFVSDMLKFEGEEVGAPLLDKEYFTTAEVLEDALDILIGMRIFIQVSTTKDREGKEQTWKNLVSWKRISALELD